jgi:MIP family channel proteins
MPNASTDRRYVVSDDQPTTTVRSTVMPPTWVPNAVAEAIGAFTLCFAGILVINSGAADLTGVALAQGLAIAVMVAALGHVSGGHFNPAVTLAFLLGRRIDPVMAAIYWAAQFVGGLVAAVLVAWTVGRGAVGTGTPILAGDVNALVGIVLEAIATFLLVLVIFGTVVDRRAPATVYPLAIGLTFAVGIYAVGPFSGGALNPARGFGPALVGGEWGGVAAWLIGPLLGGVLAWAVYEYVLNPRPKLTEHAAPAEQA